MTALVGMRLLGFTLTGRAVAPLLTALVVIATAYGGGPAQPGEAYSFSALVLFPVLAWQTKLLLDGEPDVQRRLAVVAAGLGRREITAGLVAAGLATLPPLVLALLLPWVMNGVQGPRLPRDLPLVQGLALGLWALLIAIPAAVALGALASRAVTRTSGRGVAVLVSGAVLAIVLGMKGSPAPWLAPPLMMAARRATDGATTVEIAIVTAWALGWAAVAMVLYVRLRRPSR